jgi:HEAT repeat protein
MACNTLAYLGPRAGDAKEMLISMLGDGDFLVRLGASTALATIEPDITEGIPVLIDGVMSAPADYRPPGVLPNIDWSYPADIRRASAQALGLIGPPAIEAVPALIGLFDYPGADVQESATQAIASIAPSDEAIIQLLEGLLADDNPVIRGNAARTLGLIGPPAEGALSILHDMLDDENKDVRGQVREAISRIERNDRVE